MHPFKSLLLLIIIQIIVSDVFCEVKHYDVNNFINKIHENCHFVLFFSDGCAHCELMLRIWNNMANNFCQIGNHDVTLAQVNCSNTKNYNLCSSQLIKKCPTIIWYPKELNFGYIYNGIMAEQFMFQMINTACPSLQTVSDRRIKLAKYVEAVQTAKLKESVQGERRKAKRRF